jgi:hypothetical protein
MLLDEAGGSMISGGGDLIRGCSCFWGAMTGCAKRACRR